MVCWLAAEDRGILDGKGQLVEGEEEDLVLENILAVRAVPVGAVVVGCGGCGFHCLATACETAVACRLC